MRCHSSALMATHCRTSVARAPTGLRAGWRRLSKAPKQPRARHGPLPLHSGRADTQTSAVSSMETPAKNLSSTTRDCCGSIRAKSPNASSSATRSQLCSARRQAIRQVTEPRRPSRAWRSAAPVRDPPKRAGASGPPRRGNAPVSPLHSLLVDEPQIGFMHQRRRLQGVLHALPFQLMRGQAAQLAVDVRHQFTQGLLVAVGPLQEQFGSVVIVRLIGLGAPVT